MGAFRQTVFIKKALPCHHTVQWHPPTKSESCLQVAPATGVLLLSHDRTKLVLGKQAKGLCDFGGKWEPCDGNSTWATAVRECEEECGITVTEEHRLGSVVLSSGAARYTVYVCTLPKSVDITALSPSTESGITDMHVVVPSMLYHLGDELHPRLRFNKRDERQQVLTLMEVYSQ